MVATEQKERKGHRSRGKGTPSKDLKKLDHNNPIKRENRGPQVPPQKNLKMIVHLWKRYQIFVISEKDKN